MSRRQRPADSPPAAWKSARSRLREVVQHRLESKRICLASESDPEPGECEMKFEIPPLWFGNLDFPDCSPESTIGKWVTEGDGASVMHRRTRLPEVPGMVCRQFGETQSTYVVLFWAFTGLAGPSNLIRLSYGDEAWTRPPRKVLLMRGTHSLAQVILFKRALRLIW